MKKYPIADVTESFPYYNDCNYSPIRLSIERYNKEISSTDDYLIENCSYRILNLSLENNIIYAEILFAEDIGISLQKLVEDGDYKFHIAYSSSGISTNYKFSIDSEKNIITVPMSQEEKSYYKSMDFFNIKDVYIIPNYRFETNITKI